MIKYIIKGKQLHEDVYEMRRFFNGETFNT